MLVMCAFNLSVLLLMFTMPIFCVCYAIYRGHLLAVCSSLVIVHYSFKLTLTLLELVILLIGAPSLVIAFFLASLSLQGNPRNKLLSPTLVLKLIRALTTTTAEVIWLRWLLDDLGVVLSEPTPLFCANTMLFR